MSIGPSRQRSPVGQEQKPLLWGRAAGFGSMNGPSPEARERSPTRRFPTFTRPKAAIQPSITNLPVEPDVFHPVAVVDAVDHRRQSLDIRLRAGAPARVEDDRSGALLDQPPLDLPHQLFALIRVGLARLLVDQSVDLLVAVAG